MTPRGPPPCKTHDRAKPPLKEIEKVDRLVGHGSSLRLHTATPSLRHAPVIIALRAVPFHPEIHKNDLSERSALQGGAEAQAVIAALDDAIIASGHYGPDVPDANGLSIYLTSYPYPYGSYYTGYKKLKFADEVTGWMSYIDALAQ